MQAEDAESPEGADVPWLREMVDDDLLGLFSDEPAEVRRCVRGLLARAQDDPGALEQVLEAFRASLEHQNDDTQATVWMALLLGEIGDPSAFHGLFLGLGCGDEAVQEASRDAILRIGAPAVMALMDEIDEEPGAPLVESGYRLLGLVGSLGDPDLRERAMDFLADRVEREAAQTGEAGRIEGLFQASAFLGDRRMIPLMDRVLRTRFRNGNGAIQDARDMLAENADGDPLVHDRPPWIEEHRWLFEEDLEEARVDRRRGKGSREETPVEEEPDPSDPEAQRLSGLLWGLGGAAERKGKPPLDARRFLSRPDDGLEGGEGPGGQEEEEEEEEEDPDPDAGDGDGDPDGEETEDPEPGEHDLDDLDVEDTDEDVDEEEEEEEEEEDGEEDRGR